MRVCLRHVHAFLETLIGHAPPAEDGQHGENNQDLERRYAAGMVHLTLPAELCCELLQRCLYPLVNEGAKILDEGIALRASDIDVIWIHGYGFPRHRGGPMFWADTIGLPAIAETLQRFQADQGPWMEPSPLLLRLAAEGKGFGDL